VLEVVAHEDDVHRRGRDLVEQGQTVALDEADGRIQVLADVANVDADPIGSDDVVDEVAAIAGEVEDRGRRIDPALEEPGDLAPTASQAGASASLNRRA
jgi:hypothetical protein